MALIQPKHITFTIPDWLQNYCNQYQPSRSVEGRMRFVIGAASENISRKTGGPFAAGVFDSQSGKLIALGVNLVTTENLSILHAEIVAISLAQKKLNTYDLSSSKAFNFQLLTSTEPCAMCLGAIPWSGIREVVTGALAEDAEKIGFDEGPKPNNWIKELTERGIQVTDKVERELAAQVLARYAREQGNIYNTRQFD